MLVFRPSVCLSSVTLCIVAKRCVLEQKLTNDYDNDSLLIYYRNLGNRI